MATDNKRHITLINTVHGEEFACNAHALYQITEKINPEIIFEETSPSFFDEYYTAKTRRSLESDTIIKYLETHRIEHIPVDIYDIPPGFWKENRYLMETIEKRSPLYRNLIDANKLYKGQYGFKYLNSDYNVNLNNQLNKEIEETVIFLNNERLNNAYSIWKDAIEKRENAILKNIYGYSKDHNFERGLFFIGAAHRNDIIAKIKEYEKQDNGIIEWNYSNYENIF